MDKFEEAYKKIINEDKVVVRTLNEAEFPEQIKKAIKDLMEVYEKAKKRKEQGEKLTKSATELGKIISDFDKKQMAAGVQLPPKYTKLVYTVLEQLN